MKRACQLSDSCDEDEVEQQFNGGHCGRPLRHAGGPAVLTRCDRLTHGPSML